MQLVQFIIIAAQSFMSWSSGATNGYPDFMKVIMMVYMGSMLTLFGNFFIKQYMSKPKKEKKGE
jgi:hypothetical protein